MCEIPSVNRGRPPIQRRWAQFGLGLRQAEEECEKTVYADAYHSCLTRLSVII